jgi:hypothetical protein
MREQRRLARLRHYDGPIFAAEMLAGLIAARVAHTGGVWVVDNTSAAYAMIRGHSGSDVVDALLRLCIRTAMSPSAVKMVKNFDSAHGRHPVCSKMLDKTSIPHNAGILFAARC